MKAEQSRDRGSAAVEFALVLPILLMLIFAIVDFGRMLSAKITVTEAAREGARAAALVGEDQGVRRVYAATRDLGDGVTPTVVGCPGAATGPDTTAPDTTAPDAVDPNDDATVTVTYRFTFITPVGFLFSDDQVDLVSTGVMACLS